MIHVCLHRLLIKQDAPPEQDDLVKRAQSLNLELPESALKKLERENESIDTGVVVAIGETAFKDFGIAPQVSVGDKIAFARYGGKVIADPYTKERFLVINDEDLICKFTEE